MAPDSGDPAGTDPTIMDSAMDTGSDVGEPGDRPAEPLSDDERALLERLVEDGDDQSTVVVTDAPEDSPAAARAAADDTVLDPDTGRTS